MDSRPVLEVEDLRVEYPVVRGGVFPREVDRIRAVRGVSMVVNRSEIVGVVGESGSGKTSLLRACALLERPVAGSVRVEGTELLSLGTAELEEVRRGVQVVFQSPYWSLNPARRIGVSAREPMDALHSGPRRGRRRRVLDALHSVGLDSTAAGRSSQELSGGMRQRASIARALTVSPRLLLADEPVSSLDVSVQAQVLELIRALRDQFGLAVLLVTHDLAVVRAVCDSVVVMKDGLVQESGKTEAIFAEQRSEYTRELFAAARAVHRGEISGG